MSHYITSGDGASEPGYLILMRHGQTAWSVTGQYTGRTDLPLTRIGEQQAKDGGKRLHKSFPDGFEEDCVYASPLRRARQTAELAGFPAYQTTENLAEWDYGRAEGRTRGEVSQHLGHDWCLWTDGTESLGADMDGDWIAELSDGAQVAVHNGKGEVAEDVAARTRALIEEVDRKVLAGHNVLLVAHAHVLRILTAQWLGLDPHAGRMLRFDTAHFSVLGYYKNDRVIDRWNL